MDNEELKQQEIIEEEEGISLAEIWMHIKRHMLAIIVIVVIFTAGGFVFNAVKKPEYKSRATLLVQYESGSNNLNSDLSFSNQISNTFVEFIKKDIVLKPVAEKFDISVKSLRDNLSVSNSGKSLIVDINYETKDEANAQNIVNEVINQTLNVINQKNEDDKPIYTMLYNNLQVLSYADEAKKVSKTVKYVGVFFLLGLVIAGGYVLVCVLTDKRFKSNEEIERVLGLPVLAGIPTYDIDNDKKGRK